MALTTYSELQAAVASWLHRDDLTAQIPDFIRLAEADMQVRAKLSQWETEASALGKCAHRRDMRGVSLFRLRHDRPLATFESGRHCHAWQATEDRP